MKNLIEFSIHGDIYLFLDSLSEEEFAIVSAYVKKRFGSHQLDDHQIDTFISEVFLIAEKNISSFFAQNSI